MRGGPDEGLLPKARPIPNAERRASVDGGEPTLLSDVFRRSWESEGQCHLYITGPGGVGKTVSLLTFATEEGFLPKGVPAVYVPLYDVAQYHNEKRDCIDAYLRSTFPEDEHAAIEGLSHKPWDGGPSLILLLDGHNEVPLDARDDVDRGIRKWAGRGGTQVVTTSRIPSLTGVASNRQVELRSLSQDEVETYLTECKLVPPPEDSSLWQVLETPLMLRLYADVEAFRDAMGDPYVNLEEPDSAGHLVCNYIQRELWRVIKWNKGDFSKAEYAAALLLTLPYVCWRMESVHEFRVDADRLEGYVQEACGHWMAKERPRGFTATERRLRSRLGIVDADEFVDSQLAILSDETGLVSWNGSGYSLLHQSLRDGFAAIHLKNAMEAPYDELPVEFRCPISEYVKDFLADVCDDGALGALWETNRAKLPTDATATGNLLRAIHRRRDGDLTALDWSGMDLRGTSLFPYRRGIQLELSKRPEHFIGTALNAECFRPQDHIASVNSLSFSPDGSIIASGSDDRKVIIRRASTNMQIARLRHQDAVKAVCFSSDGRSLAVATESDTVLLWDVTSQAVTATLANESDWVRTLCYSPDSKVLATGCDDGTVRLWDTDDASLVAVLKGHTECVNAVCYSADGRFIASGGGDGAVLLWEAKTNKMIGRLVHRLGVNSACFSPCDHILAVGTGNDEVCLWDTNTQALVATLEGHMHAINSVSFSPDGKQLASGSDDGGLLIWDISARRYVSGLRMLLGDPITSVSFSPEGNIVAYATKRGVVGVWDPEVGKPMGTPSGGYRCRVEAFSVCPDEPLLVCGSDSGSVQFWDYDRCALVTSHTSHRDTVSSISFSPDGRKLASCSREGMIGLWERTGNGVRCETRDTWERAYAVCFSRDGRSLVSSHIDGKLRLWDTSELNVGDPPVLGHCSLADSMCFSPDGRLFVATNTTSVLGKTTYDIRIWDTTTRNSLVATLKGHGDKVTSLCFLPDGNERTLVSASWDGTVRLWDLNELNNNVEHVLYRNPQERINSICLSPNGRYLASASFSGLRLWNMSRKDDESTFARIQRRSIQCVLFLPDSKTLVSSSYDGVISFWDVSAINGSARPIRPIKSIYPLMGINVCGLDFTRAVIEDEHDKEQLRQNGVVV